MQLVGTLKDIRFNEKGLVPAVAQDVATGAVLMVAYMNAESVQETIRTGQATYYSRSREKLWRKGETSGHVQTVREMVLDCDGDTILLKVEQNGPACHTNSYSCFHQPIARADGPARPGFEALSREFATILDRKEHPKEGSYTNYLFDKGVEKICKKVGEESSEVIIAAMKGSNDEMRYEIADLLYHTMVLMANQGLSWEDVLAEVAARK